MTKHTNCDHEATPAARAKCRGRAIATVRAGQPRVMATHPEHVDAPRKSKRAQPVKLSHTYELIERAVDQRGRIDVIVVTGERSVAVDVTHINSASLFGCDFDGDPVSFNRRDIINIRLS